MFGRRWILQLSTSQLQKYISHRRFKHDNLIDSCIFKAFIQRSIVRIELYFMGELLQCKLGGYHRELLAIAGKLASLVWTAIV